MRWIWIDKFTEFTSRKSASAIKSATLAEDHMHDVYGDYPIVPHSLIVEGMAQTAGIRSRLVTFGAAGDYRHEGGSLWTPQGELIPAAAMPRHSASVFSLSGSCPGW